MIAAAGMRNTHALSDTTTDVAHRSAAVGLFRERLHARAGLLPRRTCDGNSGAPDTTI